MLNGISDFEQRQFEHSPTVRRRIVYGFEFWCLESRQRNRMKSLSTLFTLFAASFCLVSGQEPPLPAKTDTPTPSPSARPQLDIPDIPSAVEPPLLVPNTSPVPSVASDTAPAEKAPPLSQLDEAFKRSPLGQAEEEHRLHIEWRKLQNRTAHDPEVVAAKKAAEKSRTDLEKRNLLRIYYKLHYAHMQALADSPELKRYLDAKKKAFVDGLAQPRVRPEPSVRPSPAS
jgi:hypothetical protein